MVYSFVFLYIDFAEFKSKRPEIKAQLLQTSHEIRVPLEGIMRWRATRGLRINLLKGQVVCLYRLLTSRDFSTTESEL
jgi:hypothetical protein